jgi:hypothetical protein
MVSMSEQESQAKCRHRWTFDPATQMFRCGCGLMRYPTREDFPCPAERTAPAEPPWEPDRDSLAGPAAEREVGHGGLQEQCDAYAASQWPPWLAYGPRSDKRSTLPVGANDRIYVLPGGISLWVEFKSATGKRTPEQNAWAKKAEMLGIVVHLIRSKQEFIEAAMVEIRKSKP